MPGELDEYINATHKKVMKKPIEKNLDDELREKGLI